MSYTVIAYFTHPSSHSTSMQRREQSGPFATQGAAEAFAAALAASHPDLASVSIVSIMMEEADEA